MLLYYFLYVVEFRSDVKKRNGKWWHEKYINEISICIPVFLPLAFSLSRIRSGASQSPPFLFLFPSYFLFPFLPFSFSIIMNLDSIALIIHHLSGREQRRLLEKAMGWGYVTHKVAPCPGLERISLPKECKRVKDHFWVLFWLNKAQTKAYMIALWMENEHWNQLLPGMWVQRSAVEPLPSDYVCCFIYQCYMVTLKPVPWKGNSDDIEGVTRLLNGSQYMHLFPTSLVDVYDFFGNEPGLQWVEKRISWRYFVDTPGYSIYEEQGYRPRYRREFGRSILNGSDNGEHNLED